jgi:hypothetical protein
VAPNPGERQRQLVLVGPRSAVEQLAGAVECLQAAGVAGGVVDEAVLQRERAQTGVLHVVGNRNLEVVVEVRS